MYDIWYDVVCNGIVMVQLNKLVFSLLPIQHLVPNPVRMEGPAQLLTHAPVMWGGRECNVNLVGERLTNWYCIIWQQGHQRVLRTLLMLLSNLMCGCVKCPCTHCSYKPLPRQQAKYEYTASASPQTRIVFGLQS